MRKAEQPWTHALGLRKKKFPCVLSRQEFSAIFIYFSSSKLQTLCSLLNFPRNGSHTHTHTHTHNKEPCTQRLHGRGPVPFYPSPSKVSVLFIYTHTAVVWCGSMAPHAPANTTPHGAQPAQPRAVRFGYLAISDAPPARQEFARQIHCTCRGAAGRGGRQRPSLSPGGGWVPPHDCPVITVVSTPHRPVGLRIELILGWGL